jgi:uncharacterized protein
MAFGVVLGAPKITAIPDEVQRKLGQVSMDVCAFVGVAPRGPVRRHQTEPGQSFNLQNVISNWEVRDRTVAVKVRSWEQFRHLYGGFESPGRLAYAVANFFEQGGQQAYICRIVHQYASPSEDLASVASATVDNLLIGGAGALIQANNEGVWGNQLRAGVGYSFTPVEILYDHSDAGQITVADKQNLTPSSLLRVINDDPTQPANNYAEYRFVEQWLPLGDSASQHVNWRLDFSANPLPAKPTSVQWVEGQMQIEDSQTGQSEAFSALTFSPAHPRFIGTVLLSESNLVQPQKAMLIDTLLPLQINPFELDLAQFSSQRQLASNPIAFSGGEDRYQDIEHEDFFDSSWVLGDERPGSGVHCLTQSHDCSMLVVPDLYVPELFEKIETNDTVDLLSGAEFAPCVSIERASLDIEQASPTLPNLLLDPTLPADRQQIIYLQQRLAFLAEQLTEFIVLLDVPPQQTPNQILQWRAQFNGRYSAAYHPWLKVNQFNGQGQLGTDPKIINPSAVAAGIIAATELQKNISHGPANRIAESVFALQIQVSDSFHDQLHPLGINVFKQQRDGVWLTAARTLSQQNQWRQLSVVRFMVMLRRMLHQQMQWLVFEPNTPALWLDVQFKIGSFLRQLFIAGAFKGQTPQQAYFVRCDETLNTRQVVDSGRLVAQIGVAPAEPLEYIILQFSRQADGTLRIVSQ